MQKWILFVYILHKIDVQREWEISGKSSNGLNNSLDVQTFPSYNAKVSENLSKVMLNLINLEQLHQWCQLQRKNCVVFMIQRYRKCIQLRLDVMGSIRLWGWGKLTQRMQNHVLANRYWKVEWHQILM